MTDSKTIVDKLTNTQVGWTARYKKGIRLKVMAAKEGCRDCYFHNKGADYKNCKMRFACTSIYRNDKESVKFVKFVNSVSET